MANNDSPEKKSISLNLLNRDTYTSPQVLFECINVCRKKLKLNSEIAFSFAENLLQVNKLIEENANIVYTALQLCRQSSFQPFDAKIVATALEAGCNTLYSEDMHHGLLVNNSLRIINPFV
jgi:predicted nucleic acid-binding protein